MELDYESLELKDGALTPDGLVKIRDLVKVSVEGNIIYICNPKHVFDCLEIELATKTVLSVDLNSVNVPRMKGIGQFGQFSIVEQLCSKDNNQLAYLYKHSNHMLKKYREQGQVLYSSPYAIIEEHIVPSIEQKEQYSVRGIINFTQDGISIAYCPSFNRTFPKSSVWEEGLSISGNYPR